MYTGTCVEKQVMCHRSWCFEKGEEARVVHIYLVLENL